MSDRRRVQTGRDTILSRADGADPVDAIAELIWNGLDAEADRISVEYDEGELGSVTEFCVTDNGHGMTYAGAIRGFEVDGESWKKTRRFSPNDRLPLHGQYGRGRFLAYRLAEKVVWDTRAVANGTLELTRITGYRSTPNVFVFEGPGDMGTDPELAPGTSVTATSRQMH